MAFRYVSSKLTARYATEAERAVFERDSVVADLTADEVVITVSWSWTAYQGAGIINVPPCGSIAPANE
jgi:hypothetical protein